MMSSPPTGIVTFLFTDIEGSTRLAQQDPAAWADAKARHHAILRRAIESHNGHVFQIVGDAFCAAFHTAPDALASALDAQRALQTPNQLSNHPIPQLRVRMGIHTGDATARPDGEYDGYLTLVRVQRIVSAAHGGQVLLSGATAEALRNLLPTNAQLRDMGKRRLKGFDHAEPVFQIVVPDLPADFPPIRAADERFNNLPLQTTPFIGREQVIAALKQLFTGAAPPRLVTLTGPGGTGKTRLALRVAAELLEHFDDGVCFVPLAPIRRSELVMQTIAQTFGLREMQGKSLLAQLQDYLREKHLLLVVDNFEQVIDAAPGLSGLLESAPRLTILVTSRIVLRLYTEVDFAVPPLRLPDPTQRLPLAQLTRIEAIALFVERARAVKRDFTLTGENAPAVAEVCRRLDGLPLAIELAAARARLLPPPQMVRQLESRLRFLIGGARDLPARQQTLRHAIEWSHDLLTAEDQTLFRRLAVFAGGCDLEAVEAVCNLNSGVEVLNGLESLIDQSLLNSSEVNGEPRFSMLETIREYANERLGARTETAEIHSRHVSFFLSLVEQAAPELRGFHQLGWFDRLEREHDNLRAALTWCIREREAETALRLCTALARFWEVRGYLREGRQWLEQALEVGRSEMSTTQSPDYRALYGWAQFHTALSASSQGDFSVSRALFDECLSLFRELHEQTGAARTLIELGNLALHQREHAQAQALAADGLSAARESGDSLAVAYALNIVGRVAARHGNHAVAQTSYEESLAVFRRLGDRSGIAALLNNLGLLAEDRGETVTARRLHEETLTLQRELGDRRGIPFSLMNLGNLALVQGDYATAYALHMESLSLFRELGMQQFTAYALINLGNVIQRQGDYPTARAALAESMALLQSIGDRWGIAAVVVGYAGIAAATGQPRLAATLSGAVEALLEAIGARLDRIDRNLHDQTIATARAQLDETAFNAAWSEGRALTLEQAIALTLDGGG